jgi:putative transposase
MDFENNTVNLPKIGKIKVVLHKAFEEELKTATISKSCTGKYYISILVEDGKELPVKQMLFESTTIGVNIGIRDFVLFQLKKRLKILSTRKTL